MRSIDTYSTLSVSGASPLIRARCAPPPRRAEVTFDDRRAALATGNLPVRFDAIRARVLSTGKSFDRPRDRLELCPAGRKSLFQYSRSRRRPVAGECSSNLSVGIAELAVP